jgi:hypothetical protein
MPHFISAAALVPTAGEHFQFEVGLLPAQQRGPIIPGESYEASQP